MVSITIDNELMLRTYREEDAAALFDAVNNSRAHLGPWLDWVAKTTKPEHSLQFIKQSLHEQHNQESLAMGIFYNGVIIGGIGMHKWDQLVRRAQIGYWLAKEHEGKGVVTRCATRLADHLFDVIGLNKIELHFVPANKRSAKVAERLGCRIEGIIRQSILRNGMPEDIVVTGLLKSERKKAL